MTYPTSVTLTTKGQITVPKAVIAQHGFNRGDEFHVEILDEDTLRFTRVNRGNHHKM